MPVINSDVLADPPAAASQPHHRHGPAPAGKAAGPTGLNAGKVRLCRYFGTASGMFCVLITIYFIDLNDLLMMRAFCVQFFVGLLF
jgi:hypothetical protein